MAETLTPKRGEIYLVGFDPAIGSEIKKTRPALVIQNDIANRYSPVVIVSAISSKFGPKIYPTEVFLQPPMGNLKIPCVVKLDQIKTVDKKRLIKKIGCLDAEMMILVNRAAAISLELIDI
ncbi:MAG TPA: type II toxin-antitoxin system PemK/MazF family toxin [Candidatus Pacearchaeota archaeon]|jgi:mRNA interferase MazF|nr:type II toxin-antitoxin system PemK/MazF family toxin [Candidatus Pacearchaeota archaeon]